MLIGNDFSLSEEKFNMKIATYNIWNSENGMPRRRKYIIDEIQVIDADVIGLQEVPNRAMAEDIAMAAGYQHCFFEHYPNNEEGLCILSKIPFGECDSWFDETNAIYCSFVQADKKIAVINVHLPWDSVAERERQIVDIVTAIDEKQYDYVYMVGDFNCSDSSDVQRFLNGECLLDNRESKPCWYDLALSYAELKNITAEYTLNFRKNPRFKYNTIETNSRFDRILLRNTYPCEFPILKKCTIFGQRVYEDINLSASDHYGVVVEME